MRRLLRLPGFGRLLTAYTLNELAWAVGTLALAVLVYRRTGSALGSAGFFLCSQGAPAVLSPVLVTRLDRASPRLVLPLLYGLEAVLFGVLAWMTHRFSLVPVLALALADGVVALTARSLAAAARAAILKPVDLLRDGNALFNGVFSVCFMGGPLLGGVVVAVGGTVAALLANCVLFAAIGLMLVGASLPGAANPSGPESGRLRAALAQVRRDHPLTILLCLQAIVVVFFTIPTPVEVVYTGHTLHAGAAGYGALVSAWGGGAIVGSLVFARWRHQSARVLLTLVTVVIGIGLGVMTVAPDLGVALGGAAVAGVANGIGTAVFQTEIQDRSPQAWLAVVTSLTQAIGQLSPGLGFVLGGVIATLTSARFALGVAGAGSLAFAVVIAVLLTPRRMARPERHTVPAQVTSDPATLV